MNIALYVKAVIMGLIQGLTEFLPVSSSGHLALADHLLSYLMPDAPELNQSFDVALHFGTLVALVIYFREEVVSLIRATVGLLIERSYTPRDSDGPEVAPRNYQYRRMVVLLIVATLPAAILGLKYDHQIEEWTDTWAAVPYIAGFLLVFGLLMWVADRFGSKARDVWGLNLGEVLAIGCVQSFALMPGVSRSGSTITAGLALGLKREEAARFSFLMCLPVVLGACILKGFKGLKFMLAAAKAGQLALVVPSVLPFVVGVLVSFISGWLCIHFLMRYLQNGSFMPFVIYRVVGGALLLAFFH